MRRLFRRSILWLLPVVLLPIGALAVAQYRVLRALEQKTASAERNWLRNSLELATNEIDTRYRRAANDALRMTESQLASVTTLGKHFATHPVPGARTFFAVRFYKDYAEHGFFDAKGKEKHPSWNEAEAIKMSTVAWHVAHDRDRVLPQPTLTFDQRDPQHRLILRPIVDTSMHIVGVAGVILDEKHARAAMLKIGKEAIAGRHPGKLISLQIAEKFPSGGRDYITQPLGMGFSDLRAGLRDQCASPEDVARMNFRTNMMWTGGAFVVLVGAVMLAIGAVARQMRLSQMKSEFVSNVSHELRTPLSSIRVFGEYMRLGRVQNPEKVQQYGEYIEAESRRLTALINNILDFSKIESAEKKYRFCDTDLVDHVEQTVAAFEVPLREQGVSIAFSAPAEPLPLLPIDKDAFGQALVNLLDNAVKYSNGRKEIEVAVSMRGDEVRISVRDHGIGIAASEQKKIFEKFYRVGSGLVHDVKGSGLGLSIVQHVVQAHGGRVEVSSTPGEGTTFTIVLPVFSSSRAKTRDQWSTRADDASVAGGSIDPASARGMN
ncbi:MAG TPA: HAMP domain-containing sensor histidine kinase [Thermoanaerobaculia bacterium]|nr:HAMP domain-containing sensor histidine kinase [Thermoanaerobaculia bacterium]